MRKCLPWVKYQELLLVSMHIPKDGANRKPEGKICVWKYSTLHNYMNIFITFAACRTSTFKEAEHKLQPWSWLTLCGRDNIFKFVPSWVLGKPLREIVQFQCLEEPGFQFTASHDVVWVILVQSFSLIF